jgi:hypothetical protein
MGEREPFYRMDTFVLLRWFSYDHNANLLPIIPTSFQQFSEKQCGKQQRAIETMQQSCVF